MADENEVQAVAESLADQVQAAVAGLGLDQALLVLDVVSDRIGALRSGVHEDYTQAVVRGLDISDQAPPDGRGRNDQLDVPAMPTVQNISGPADLSDLEKQVKP